MDTLDTLTPKTTCDRCGPAVSAQIAVNVYGTDLALCGHHFRKHQTALSDADAIVVAVAPHAELIPA